MKDLIKQGSRASTENKIFTTRAYSHVLLIAMTLLVDWTQIWTRKPDLGKKTSLNKPLYVSNIYTSPLLSEF